jgi:hypothetical protein
MTDLAEIAERFARETNTHVMEVLHDDGLYRHLRCQGRVWRPPLAQPLKTSFFWFEIITVPGSLTFRGDGDSFVFARVTDMFEFFRGQRVNPGYWAEKLTSNRDAAMVYSEDLLRQVIADNLGYSYPEGVPAALHDAVEEMLEENGHYEDLALRAAHDFEWYADDADRWAIDKRPDFQFEDLGEWHVRDYDWWLLWALHGIVWGIGQYDQAKGQCSYDLAKLLAPRPETPRAPLKVLDPEDDRPTLGGQPVDTEFAAGGVL